MQTIQELGSYTFQAMLANSIKRFGTRPALSFVSETPLTYNEVAEKITDLKNR